MGPFEVAVIAIVGWLIYSAWSKWVKATKGGVNQKQLQELEQRVHALEAQHEVQDLQKRVNVLEEIVVTDDFEFQKKLRHLE